MLSSLHIHNVIFLCFVSGAGYLKPVTSGPDIGRLV